VPNPFSSPQEYVVSIGEVVRRRQIQAIVPIHEDALAIQANRETLPAGTIVAAPSEGSLRQALDKGLMTKVAASAGLRVPATYQPTSADDARDFLKTIQPPVVVKTRRGNSGKGVVIARSAEEAQTAFLSFVERLGLSDGQLPVIQSFVSGKPCGSCFLADEGNLVACFAERYLYCKERGFGTSVVREPTHHPRIVDATERLAAKLGWTGIAHLDFLVDPHEDEPVFLEMNPRFWGALQMAIANGYDFPKALVDLYAVGAVDSRALQQSQDTVTGVWALGLAGAVLGEILAGHLGAPVTALRMLSRRWGEIAYDDLSLRDPLPFLAEFCDYGIGFARSGFSLNPVNLDMLRSWS